MEGKVGVGRGRGDAVFLTGNLQSCAMCADSKIGVGSAVVLFECLVGKGRYYLFVFLVPAHTITKIQ
jgi:hypothetical protein